MIMETNLFTDLQNKKKALAAFAKAALEKKWIEQETYDGIMQKLNNDTLTIGVIGQMKCGKSTFLNAFVFEKDILPAATTPMTAALSVITYGEKEEIKAEFYSSEEWEELKMQAERNLEDVKDDAFESSKIKAARELLDKSRKIGNISALLGKTKTDSLNNLVEYVGADGQYVAITKSVTIHYPKEWLKGVEIVDTPGFNDPVVSREVRTQEFLKKADVVLLLLYAGRAFDATDRDIVFEKVRSVGVGKILIGVNKYDLCYEKGETEEEIVGNVSAEIKKACNAYSDSSVSELLRNEKPILFSASMALMAKMPISQIRNDEDYNFHWQRTCDIFEISTQREMLSKSLIANLDAAVRSLIEKSKGEILFRKPVNMIFQAGVNRRDELNGTLTTKKELLKSLEMPDNELEDRISNLNKAQRRIEKKIDRALTDLSEKYDDEVTGLIRSLESEMDNTKKEVDNIIETEKTSQIERRVKGALERLAERTVPRKTQEAQKKFTSLIKDTAEELVSDIADLMRRYVEDSNDLLEEFTNTIRKELAQMDDGDSGSTYFTTDGIHKEEKGSGWVNLLWLAPIPVVGLVGTGIIGGGYLLLRSLLSNVREEYQQQVDEIFAKMDFSELRNYLKEHKQEYLDLLSTESAKGILQALIEQLEKAMSNKKEKERQIEIERASVASLSEELKALEAQITEMNKLKGQLA